MNNIERSFSAVPTDARAAVAAGGMEFFEIMWNGSGRLSDAIEAAIDTFIDNFRQSLESRFEEVGMEIETKLRAAGVGPDGVNVVKLLVFLLESGDRLGAPSSFPDERRAGTPRRFLG